MRFSYTVQIQAVAVCSPANIFVGLVWLAAAITGKDRYRTDELKSKGAVTSLESSELKSRNYLTKVR